MGLLCSLALTLLWALSLSCSAAALQCKDTQYLLREPQSCCDKCPPGTHLVDLKENECTKECIGCEKERFKQTHNTDFACNICENCERPNMEYLSLCNATHNAVCKCKAGYECKVLPCEQCLPIPPTTTPTTTTTTPTTVINTVITRVHSSTTKSLQRDAAWYPVVIALLSAVIMIITVVVIVQKKTEILRWIGALKDGFPRPKPHHPAEDEEMSKPVQEAGCDCVLKTELELELLQMSQIQV